MVILFDALSILIPATVLENCLETPGVKPFSTSCVRLSCPLFVQLESFLIGKLWSSSQSLYVKKTCFPIWSLLVSVLFVQLSHLYLFVTITNDVDSLNHIFFLMGECHPVFPCVDCHTCPSIFQWNCPT